jgi:mono/diheme cytochrome c family protein
MNGEAMNKHSLFHLVLAVVLLTLGMPSFSAPLQHASAPTVSAQAGGVRDPLVARGRYLAQTAGCNDCHTPGYAERDGQVPEDQWFTGDQLGWRGPWGTTYPTNLRLRLQDFSEAQWLVFARNFRARPPMPWFNLVAMSDEDLRALYRYTRAMGPAGVPAPAYVPPDREPSPPFVTFPEPPHPGRK